VKIDYSTFKNELFGNVLLKESGSSLLIMGGFL